MINLDLFPEPVSQGFINGIMAYCKLWPESNKTRSFMRLAQSGVARKAGRKKEKHHHDRNSERDRKEPHGENQS